jgi:probable inactive protein kinase-like protein SgK071
LKKVECNDEGEASKAFQEAMALENLKNKYICGYKEFFCYWDKEDETMYVCIVMNFYETGDLETVLKQQRSKETPLPEPIVKRWFGQMVEALQFVHSQKVIHRDLKPTNIFMTKDLDIAIGDFGVATVMNDARTRTRTTVGTMTWMAPEVLERPYDERSDVWSLGCIVLDAASCGFSDTKQSQQALYDIKQNPAKLKEILSGVEASYSKDLCGVISQMLRREFQHRPSMNDLVEMPYVRSCLALSKSHLVAGDTKRAYTAASVKPKTTKRIPATTPEIMVFLNEHLSRVACVVAGLEELGNQINKGGAQPPDEAGKKHIVKCMDEHANNVWVQIAACSALTAIAQKVSEVDLIFTEPFVRYVVEAMRKHQGSAELQGAALTVISVMAENDLCGPIIGAEGGVQDVISALRMNAKEGDLVEKCCVCLFNLALHDGNATILKDEGGVMEVGNALAEHSDNAKIAASACGLFWSQSAEDGDGDGGDDSLDQLVDSGCIGLTAKALSAHSQDVDVVTQACTFLTGVVVDESCAFAVWDNEEEVDGIIAIAEAFAFHLGKGENTEVLLAICKCIKSLCEHEDIAEHLVANNVTELLLNTKLMCKSKKKADGEFAEIAATSNEALEILSGGA